MKHLSSLLMHLNEDLTTNVKVILKNHYNFHMIRIKFFDIKIKVQFSFPC